MAAAPPTPTPKLASGKLVVLLTLLGFAAIGVAFYLMGQYFSAHPIAPEADTLDYADRAAWEPMPTTTILLVEPPNYMRGPYGSKIPKELPFTLTESEEFELLALDQVARDLRTESLPSRDEPAIKWYEQWVYAAWRRHQPQIAIDQMLNRSHENSIANAPAVLVLQYLTPDDQPFASQPIGDIELTFARKADDVLDDSLRMLYPDNTTDDLGRVYLPVFDTPLKVSVKPTPPGHTADYPFDGWLIFPGNLGTPPPITVTPAPQ